MSDLVQIFSADAERAALYTASQAIDAAQRAGFDRDFGAYTGHPMDPRTPEADDDELTEDDARSEATDQILSFSESVADWLAKACDTDEGRSPLDVRALEPVQILNGSPAMLLAVLMNGDNTQALRALHRLRELAAAGFDDVITQRAAEMMREAAL